MTPSPDTCAATLAAPRISVVIPTYNRARMVCDCVRSVLATGYPNLEVIVVDDCSPDDTAAQLKAEFGAACQTPRTNSGESGLTDSAKVTYLRNEKNLMTTGSRNRGAAVATGDFLLFLDHDNRVRRDCLKELVAAFDNHPDALLVGAVSMNVEKEGPALSWAVGCDFNRWSSRPVERYAHMPETDFPDFPDVVPTTYAPNAFMVRRSTFEAVGGFDPEIGMMFDESDFGWRILEKLPGKSYFATRARTDHYGHADPLVEETPLRRLGIERPQRTYYFARNRLRFARRHFRWYQALVVSLVFAPLSALWYGRVALQNRRPDIAGAYLRGTLRGIWGLR